jgi:hypothetical protein
MMLVRAPSRVLLLRRATGQPVPHADSLDHQHALLHFDIALRV